jgi:hypothetical protein
LGDDHVSVKSVSKQVGDRQMKFKSRKPLAHRRNDDSLVLANGENGEWTPHDLRRTAATMMQALRVGPDVIDRCQNHVLPGSKGRRHYLHHDYAEEKRAARRLLGGGSSPFWRQTTFFRSHVQRERPPVTRRLALRRSHRLALTA